MDLVESDPAPPAVRDDWGWGGTVTVVTGPAPDIRVQSTRREDPARLKSGAAQRIIARQEDS
jgi:hypothetical protein